MSNPNYKFSPSKLSPLSLTHFPILLHALLDGFLWDSLQLCHHGPLDGFRIQKTGPLDDLLELKEKDKIT